MSQDSDDPNVIDILGEMYTTDREFYNVLRFLNAQTRNQALITQQRINERTVLLLNRYLNHLERQPRRLVMNIPLNLGNANQFWDAVNVVPTQEQIEAAVERLVPVQDATCTICQEPLTSATRIRHCGHTFHGNCINEWFELNPRCPVCRHDIRENAQATATDTAVTNSN
jgi:hypothetical protein